ncbi:MAG TPA: phosphonoacetaldehyde hydrolase [Spirochaetia bacterium]|nr:phosphonoacetaldehyde hydrolase [Spirochaetia bacterium]
MSSKGSIAAVVFDWAGTIVDFGCFAPTVSIVETFADRGIQVTLAEARGPMGLEKKEHLRRLLDQEGIRRQWRATTGSDPTPSDAQALYEELEPRLFQAVKRYSELVPGARELTAELHASGIGIGSSTGYLRPLMDVVCQEAAAQGLLMDEVICPSDVPAGRPYPWMCFLNAMRLNACPMSRVVKIGDTPADMQEGVNAGAWVIGVTLSGNEVGLSASEAAEMDPADREALLRAAETRLLAAGAHYVTESVATCREVLTRIDERIARGEQPSAERVHERV